MSFSNTQSTKNMSSQLILWHHEFVKIISHDIFKYAISKKYVIMFLYNVLIYDVF